MKWSKISDGWELKIDVDNGPKRLQISKVDQFTKDNCRRYRVDYDPKMKYSLFRVYDTPFEEYVLDSLYRTLKDAKWSAVRLFNRYR